MAELVFYIFICEAYKYRCSAQMELVRNVRRETHTLRDTEEIDRRVAALVSLYSEKSIKHDEGCPFNHGELSILNMRVSVFLYVTAIR